jgi:hypothetical protein
VSRGQDNDQRWGYPPHNLLLMGIPFSQRAFFPVPSPYYQAWIWGMGMVPITQRQQNNAIGLSIPIFFFNLAVLIYESLETRRVPRDAVSKCSGIELFSLLV